MEFENNELPITTVRPIDGMVERVNKPAKDGTVGKQKRFNVELRPPVSGDTYDLRWQATSGETYETTAVEFKVVVAQNPKTYFEIINGSTNVSWKKLDLPTHGSKVDATDPDTFTEYVGRVSGKQHDAYLVVKITAKPVRPGAEVTVYMFARRKLIEDKVLDLKTVPIITELNTNV